MIEVVLEEIGLTKNEIKTYMALLELGEARTGSILKESGLNSGKIYEILESLKQKGLVSEVIKSNIKHYSASNPKRLLEHIEQKKESIEKQKKDYEKILPDLLRKINEREVKPKIEIYVGFEGMKTAYSKELERPKNSDLYILGLDEPDVYPTHWHSWFYKQYPLRKERNYAVHKLISEKARKHIESYKEKNSKIKFLPYGSVVAVSVIGDLTTIGIFTKDPIFISIESKDVADTFTKQFKHLWQAAK